MVDATDRRAQALAEITTMQSELVDAHSKINQLQRDLDQANDRIALLAEERRTYRDDSLLFRAKLVELSTSMANIGMLTAKATEIMTAIGPLVTPQSRQDQQDDSDGAAKVIGNLPPAVDRQASDAVAVALLGENR